MRCQARFNTQERVIADKITNYVNDANINFSLFNPKCIFTNPLDGQKDVHVLSKRKRWTSPSIALSHRIMGWTMGHMRICRRDRWTFYGVSRGTVGWMDNLWQFWTAL